MNRPRTLLLTLLAVLVVCLALLALRDSTNSKTTLTLYCAAGLQAPINAIVEEYEQQTGTSIQVIYNGSGALLSQLQLGRGDLYLPANQSYINQAGNYLTGSATSVVAQQAVIVVHQSNQSIHSLSDLSKPNIKISFAEDSAAIGRYTKNLLQRHQLWDTIQPNIIVYKPTVNGVIEDVALRSADATIAWKNTAQQFPNIKTIDTSILNSPPQFAAISILKSSNSKPLAQKFITFLTTHASSQTIFKKHHYEIVQ
ncbi:molybdate ABC transporter substrate-binding protein [Rubritalea spongiae]|uniref:Molybdate ABC transporter substrate-binding protein n=1 Tax=Rubritalea spongiae TaxID=430797 RepID=A0ABW5DXY0_9BACT